MNQTKPHDSFVYIVIGIIAVIIIAIAIIRMRQNNNNPDTDVATPAVQALASCIASSGTKFYGAFWCPHCKEQKAMFGTAVSKLPYVECAIDENTETQICKDAGIQGFPTWINKSGARKEGVLSFADLTQFSGCPFTP